MELARADKLLFEAIVEAVAKARAEAEMKIRLSSTVPGSVKQDSRVPILRQTSFQCLCHLSFGGRPSASR